MPLSSIFFDILFLFCVTIIWAMILYQLVLTLFGYKYRRHAQKELADIRKSKLELPAISILIPARDEEVVIRQTLRKILDMDYPPDKMEVIDINDGSIDKTGLIVGDMASKDPRIRLLNLPEVDVGRGNPMP